MTPSLLLAKAHIRRHKGKAATLSLIFSLLLFLPAFLLTSLHLIQNQLRERAVNTPLILTTSGGKVEALLHHLHFQWNDEPSLFTPTDSFELFDERPIDGIPMLLIYKLLSKNGDEQSPLLCTHTRYLELRNLSLAMGRTPLHPGEVVLGAELAKNWSIAVGEELMTAPHRLLDLSKAHQLHLKVVGILKPSGGPEDHLAITLPETGWIKMGLGHGHPEEKLEGVPESLHMSIHSEQIGYRRIDESNRSHIHFHQPKSLLPLTGMILLPKDENDRLHALAWGMNHPSLEVLDPVSITEQILSSLHRLKDILLLMVTVVSLTSLIMMGLFLRINFIMRKRDGEVLSELGIPNSTFILAITLEWFFYLTTGMALAVIVLGLSWAGGLPVSELLGLIKS